MKYPFLIFGLSLLMSACSPAPQPIDFGADACAHCKMNIVQPQFAAELVNTKGKAIKFDAIECMMDYLTDKDEADFAYLLVRDYNSPEDWADARQCYFLISKEIPSPMGGFLSAFISADAATDMAQAKGGDIYRWEELKKLLQ